MFLSEFKKQASSFLHEKYNSARLVLTDVTQAELLTEEATNDDPWGPDSKTMTRISEAAFDIDDYWRIIDILHRRLYTVDWKKWRQSYKTLVLLDFLLTHGPETVANEFHSNKDVIHKLANFKQVDEKGFNWGLTMKKRSERILKLLNQADLLRQERSRALKISKEIQGFGNLIVSPSSSSSRSSRTSFGSYSSTSSTWWPETELPTTESTRNFIDNSSEKFSSSAFPETSESGDGLHLWDSPIQENNSLLNLDEEEEERGGSPDKTHDKFIGLFGSGSWRKEMTGFRSFSSAGRKELKKKIDRQSSLGW